MKSDAIPYHMELALAEIGVVMLIKKPEPRRDPQQPSGWKPSFVGEEPPF